MASLQLDPDRALPFPVEQRSIAREIYGQTKDLPLICMHGHVEPRPDRRLRRRPWVPSTRATGPLQYRGHLDDGLSCLGPAAPRQACRRRSGLSVDEAVETAIDLTYNLPKESYPAPNAGTCLTRVGGKRG
jgi:hypothetical protein